MKINNAEFAALLRNDFVSFCQKCFHELNPTTAYQHNWHIDLIAAALEECRTGQLSRLAINVPPRSLKSHMVSVCYVAWLLGHNPSASIICVSYAQDLADKLAGDCRTIMSSAWYQRIFPGTRLASRRQAVHDFVTTSKGGRLATSLGGILTGRGADFIIIDDPLKPEEALSEVQRKNANDWYDHTLVSRLNDKRKGCIIIIMQRLHEDDLVGHVLQQGGWRLLKFPAIAEEPETHVLHTAYGPKTFHRSVGEALHPSREPLEVLSQLREVLGEYNFAGQYQQAPAPLGGGIVKIHWWKAYKPEERPDHFSMVLQSWDTANKPKELCAFSVCTTWGASENHLYLIDVFRQRLDYPQLKRAVRDQLDTFKPQTVLIEDKASGIQLIQDLINEGVHQVKQYSSQMDKIMRMRSMTSMIENGFVHIPDKAEWLGEYLHELSTFPNGKFADQVDSTSQALDWYKSGSHQYGLLEYRKREIQQLATFEDRSTSLAAQHGRPCTNCSGFMTQRICDFIRCPQCGAQWSPPRPLPYGGLTRTDILNRHF
jgi:predicted phage terminase large subunit-like protein